MYFYSCLYFSYCIRCIYVAILVIMEDVFLRCIKTVHATGGLVAILVIMEDVFLQLFKTATIALAGSRNPCYNGRCISTSATGCSNEGITVAILVIMEDVFLPICT